MNEETINKPPMKQYLKVAAVGSLFGLAIQVLSGIALAAPISMLVTIVLIWLILKCYQSLLASWTGFEFRTATIFWYLILSGIASSALALIVIGGTLKVAFGISTSMILWEVVAGTFFYALNVYITALLFRASSTCIPAWRPTAAYWRPFYAGFKLTVGSKPQGPQEDSDK